MTPIRRILSMNRIPQGTSFFAVWGFVSVSLAMILIASGFAPAGTLRMRDALLAPLWNGGTSAYAAPETPTPTAAEVAEKFSGPLEPARIIIRDAAIDAPIVFPSSRDTEFLNEKLTEGAVHYPGSALPGEQGNMLLFGHSTGLKVVRNPAYAVFNNLKHLEAGDVIRIRAGEREYWYEVDSVEMVKAEDARIELITDQRLLTISTCNVFGAKEDRYVLTAHFLESYSLRNPS